MQTLSHFFDIFIQRHLIARGKGNASQINDQPSRQRP
jgi:hypothetical protein